MDTEDSTATSNSRIKWWQLFLYPFTFHNLDYKSPFNQPAYTIALPFIVFIFSTFISNYSLISNDYFIEQILLKAEEKAMNSEDPELALQVIENTESVLRNPGYHIIISAQSTFVTIRNLLLFVILLWVLVSIINATWLLKSYLFAISSSVTVLSIGFFINTFLKLILLSETAMLGPALFFNVLDPQNLLYFILKKMDIFSFWFLSIFSIGTALTYKEKASFTFPLSILLWFFLITLSFILRFHFSLTS